MNKILIITVFAIFLFFTESCDSDKKIETIALVLPDEYKGEIYIYYDQVKIVGRIEKKGGKHYFYIDKSGVFFTNRKLGDGFIEYYDCDLNKMDFVSTMQLKNSENQSYQVVGGQYLGVYSKFHRNGKDPVMCSVFKAGKARDLKENWFVNDSTIIGVYERTIK